MKKLLLALVLMLTLPTLVYGAGSSCTESIYYRNADNGVVVKKIACVGDDSNGSFPDTTIQIDGYIMKVETDPGATAPQADYDLEFETTADVDMMGGELGDRHTSTSEVARPKANTTFGDDYIDTVTMKTTNQGTNDALVDVYIWISTGVGVSYY